MKKKKLFVGVLIFSLLLSGTIHAASINGLFEGFPIVNINVNGKIINSDVPGINFYGRTMVPVRFISQELGANVQWDGSTSTVYINNSINSSQNDIETIKLYSEIISFYKLLEDLGELIQITSDDLDLGYLGYVAFDDITLLDRANKNLRSTIDNYNETISVVNKFIDKSLSKGVDVSDMKTVMNKYKEALEYYDFALLNLATYANYGDGLKFDLYLENTENGTNKIYESFDLIKLKVRYFEDSIYNY